METDPKYPEVWRAFDRALNWKANLLPKRQAALRIFRQYPGQLFEVEFVKRTDDSLRTMRFREFRTTKRNPIDDGLALVVEIIAEGRTQRRTVNLDGLRVIDIPGLAMRFAWSDGQAQPASEVQPVVRFCESCGVQIETEGPLDELLCPRCAVNRMF